MHLLPFLGEYSKYFDRGKLVTKKDSNTVALDLHNKAKKILKDDKVKDRKLTDRQRRFFGARIGAGRPRKRG